MAVNHLAKIIEDSGAAAFWARAYQVTSSGVLSVAQIWRFQDLIHARDYRVHEIRESEAFCYWEPQWNNSSATAEVKNSAPCDLSLASEISPFTPPGITGTAERNWSLVPYGTTQVYGFGNKDFFSEAGNDDSPLRERQGAAEQVDPSALPGSGTSRPTTTIPGCWVFDDGDNMQAEKYNADGDKIVSSFPFTLEAWARPTSGNTTSMTGNSDGSQNGDNGYCPHNVMMVACPNPADATGAIAAGAPDTSWRHWGIGFHQGETGVPVLHWGGWKIGSPNRFQDGLYVAGPDPTRQYKPDTTGDAHDKWAHIVGIFHSQTHVQLFYNGVEVANYSGLNYHSPQTGAAEAFSNRLPDIAAFQGIQGDRPYIEGATVWLGGVNWATHGTGQSTTSHSNYAYAGRIAYPALYHRALTAKEVHDHYLTCTQEGCLQVGAESINYDSTGGVSAKGLLDVQKTRVPGLRGCDEIVVRDDTLNPPGGRFAYPAVNPIRLSDRASAALRGAYFDNAISSVTGDARYQDNAITGFANTGYGAIFALDVRRDAGTGGGSAAAGATATFMNLTGLPQFDQPGGSDDIDDALGGFKVVFEDIAGTFSARELRSFDLSALTEASANGYNKRILTLFSHPPLDASHRFKSTVYGLTHDTVAHKIAASVRKNADFGEGGTVDIDAAKRKHTLRTFQTSPDRSYPAQAWEASDHTFQIGPCALLMKGDTNAMRTTVRRMAGNAGRLRSRFSTRSPRRHFGLMGTTGGHVTRHKQGAL